MLNRDLFQAIGQYKNARSINKFFYVSVRRLTFFLGSLQYFGACTSTMQKNADKLQRLKKEYAQSLNQCGQCKRKLVKEIRKVEQALNRAPRAFK